MCSKFGVDSSSRLYLRAWTHTEIKSHTPLITLPTHRLRTSYRMQVNAKCKAEAVALRYASGQTDRHTDR